MKMSYEDFKNDYFVFVGDNATTGKPHTTTGSYSYFGDYYKFKNKSDAIEFVNNYRGFGICKMGTARTLRKYSLGCSVSRYLEALYFTGYTKTT